MTYVRLWYHYVSYCFGALLKVRMATTPYWRNYLTLPYMHDLCKAVVSLRQLLFRCAFKSADGDYSILAKLPDATLHA